MEHKLGCGYIYLLYGEILWAKCSHVIRNPSNKEFHIRFKFCPQMYHLLLLTKNSQAKSSYSNRNLCDQEICIRAKKFPVQILKVLKMVTNIQCWQKKAAWFKNEFCVWSLMHRYVTDNEFFFFFRLRNLANVTAPQ